MTSKVLSKEQRRFLEKATLLYAKNLDAAAVWLAGRGIDLEHARSRGLGVVTDPLPGHEKLRGRLSIPYLTDAGPVNINFRCMRDHNCKEVPDHGKYDKRKGSPNNLYGVQSVAWAEDWIVLCEGEIDALTWHQAGVPALGIPGANNWKEHWNNILEDFSRWYVATDGEDSGDGLWKRASFELDNAIKIEYPPGEDTNSMFVKHGKDYLLSRIKK